MTVGHCNRFLPLLRSFEILLSSAHRGNVLTAFQGIAETVDSLRHHISAGRMRRSALLRALPLILSALQAVYALIYVRQSSTVISFQLVAQCATILLLALFGAAFMAGPLIKLGEERFTLWYVLHSSLTKHALLHIIQRTKQIHHRKANCHL